jgi:hypothetical protein
MAECETKVKEKVELLFGISTSATILFHNIIQPGRFCKRLHL